MNTYKTGSMIAGILEILEFIGQGSFGLVFKVRDTHTGEICAVKMLRPELALYPEFKKSFKKELELWVGLDTNPWILDALWIVEESGDLFVEMEHIEPDHLKRVSLQDHLDTKEESWNINEILMICKQFCLGMEYAVSKGLLCHRDIKPANILITRSGNIKISDFGLAVVEKDFTSFPDIDFPDLNDKKGHLSIVSSEGRRFLGTHGLFPVS